jgi:hypothetical protein
MIAATGIVIVINLKVYTQKSGASDFTKLATCVSDR